MFGAKLLETCLAAVIALAIATVANGAVAGWVRQRYGEPYANAAGWGVFLVIAVALGFAIARFV